MSSLSYFDTQEAADEAATVLKSMGKVARKMLAEAVQTQGTHRTKASATAEALCTAGFLHIRELDGIFTTDVELSPSLEGEDALAALEDLELKNK